MKMILNLLGCGEDVRDIRFFRFSKRRRHTDDHRIGLREISEFSRRRQLPALNKRIDLFSRHVWNVRAAAIDCIDTRLIQVESDYAQPGAGELDRQRQAAVAESN